MRTETEVQTRVAFEEAVEASHLDPRVWTGAFSTQVWAGRFRIDGALGEGAQGTTFFGTDLKTDRPIAVKVFDLKGAREWKHVELFEREVAALKSLNHPGLPRYIDHIVDEETGARALVMSRVSGENYAERLKQGPLSEAEIWRVLTGASEILDRLHRAKTPLVHRDIKPANLIERPSGELGVVDLGGVSAMKTKEGSTVVGTFGYMAPEQLYGKATPATDMYALGATALTLATGIEPEDQPREGLAIDVDKAAPHLSETLRKLLAGLLAPEPKARPSDARALQKELGQLARGKKRAPQKARGDSADLVVDRVSGGVQVFLSLFGLLVAVGLGGVILPLAFKLATLVTDKKGKRVLTEMDASVALGTHTAKEKLKETMRSGMRDLRG